MIDLNSTIVKITAENITTEQSLKVLSEIFLPSFLMLWLGSILVTFILGLVSLKRDHDKILLIAIIPELILGVIILLFTFVVPVFPKLLGDLFSGMLQ